MASVLGERGYKPMKILHLHVTRKHFDQIKSGNKKEEYRAWNIYWKKRIIGVPFEAVEIYHGYPKAGAGERIIFAWDGYEKKILEVKLYKKGLFLYFAISLNGKIIEGEKPLQ